MHEKSPDIPSKLLRKTLKRLCIAVIFSIAFAYIEAAVVVYLRIIFHPDGFTFPMTEFAIGQLGKQLLLTEIGREAATIVLILTACWLFGQTRQQRFAYFLTIFAIWDVFYYLWLKVLIDWPHSIMDWDILFLIPVTWASPILAPVLISMTMLVFGVIILYRSSRARPVKVSPTDWLGFCLAAVLVVASFCIPGRHITEPDFRAHFHWPLFALANTAAVALFIKCSLKSK